MPQGGMIMMFYIMSTKRCYSQVLFLQFCVLIVASIKNRKLEWWTKAWLRVAQNGSQAMHIYKWWVLQHKSPLTDWLDLQNEDLFQEIYLKCMRMQLLIPYWWKIEIQTKLLKGLIKQCPCSVHLPLLLLWNLNCSNKSNAVDTHYP